MQFNKPTLIVIAGPNGSGKTAITTQILKHEWIKGCVYINPDQIAQDEFGDWNNIENVFKAADCFCAYVGCNFSTAKRQLRDLVNEFVLGNQTTTTTTMV